MKNIYYKHCYFVNYFHQFIKDTAKVMQFFLWSTFTTQNPIRNNLFFGSEDVLVGLENGR